MKIIKDVTNSIAKAGCRKGLIQAKDIARGCLISFLLWVKGKIPHFLLHTLFWFIFAVIFVSDIGLEIFTYVLCAFYVVWYLVKAIRYRKAIVDSVKRFILLCKQNKKLAYKYTVGILVALIIYLNVSIVNDFANLFIDAWDALSVNRQWKTKEETRSFKDKKIKEQTKATNAVTKKLYANRDRYIALKGEIEETNKQIEDLPASKEINLEIESERGKILAFEDKLVEVINRWREDADNNKRCRDYRRGASSIAEGVIKVVGSYMADDEPYVVELQTLLRSLLVKLYNDGEYINFSPQDIMIWGNYYCDNPYWESGRYLCTHSRQEFDNFIHRRQALWQPYIDAKNNIIALKAKKAEIPENAVLYKKLADLNLEKSQLEQTMLTHLEKCEDAIEPYVRKMILLDRDEFKRLKVISKLLGEFYLKKEVTKEEMKEVKKLMKEADEIIENTPHGYEREHVIRWAMRKTNPKYLADDCMCRDVIKEYWTQLRGDRELMSNTDFRLRRYMQEYWHVIEQMEVADLGN